MGHIINAKSFRLGWFKNWHDNWYSNYILYPEYLYMSLRVRLYLLYFFGQKDFIKRSVLYSHFDISISFNCLSICISFYDGRLSQSVIDYVKAYDALVPTYKDKIFVRGKRTAAFVVWRLYMFLKFFGSFRYGVRWLSPRFDWFVFTLSREFNRSALSNIFKHQLNTRLVWFNYTTTIFSLFFTDIFRAFVQNHSSRVLLVDGLFSRVAYLLICFIFYTRFFKNVSDALLLILKNLTISVKIKMDVIHFFLVGAEQMNASILSRYLAIKIKQHFSIKELYKPIRKEFVVLRSSGQRSNSSYYLHYSIHNIGGRHHFFSYFWLCFVYYYRLTFIRYKSLGTWLTGDRLSVYTWLNYLMSDTLEIITFSWSFWRNDKIFSFLLLYNDENVLAITDIFAVDLLAMDFINKDFIKLRIGLSYVICANYSVSINDNMSSKWEAAYFKFVNFHANNFMRLKLFNYNYEYDTSRRYLNNLRMRDFHYLDAFVFRGFKLLFSGRFARKQRASFLWFNDGRLPLNTISGNVDYNFFVMPIRNSTICVKVWLFKCPSSPKYLLRVY